MKLIKIDLDAITLLFVGLKLSGNVRWHWWQVLAPSLIAIAGRAFVAWRKR